MTLIFGIELDLGQGRRSKVKVIWWKLLYTIVYIVAAHPQWEWRCIMRAWYCVEREECNRLYVANISMCGLIKSCVTRSWNTVQSHCMFVCNQGMLWSTSCSAGSHLINEDALGLHPPLYLPGKTTYRLQIDVAVAVGWGFEPCLSEKSWCKSWSIVIFHDCWRNP